MKTETYIEGYLLALTPGKWYSISELPRVIGLAGLSTAHRLQILLPDYEIIIGKYYATFKIVRTKIESIKKMSDMNQSKAM
jgi:hypothetical protein